MLRIAICEDNSQHRDGIVRLIREHFVGQTIALVSFSDADSFGAAVSERNAAFDIVLLDIDLGEAQLNGIDLAEVLHAAYPLCQIIFITGYVQRYASAVCETPHVYFVTKGDLTHWLPRALDRAVDEMDGKGVEALMITRNRRHTAIPTSIVLFCERHQHTTTVRTTQGDFLCGERLEELQTQPGGQCMVRCHKSFLVNLRFVTVMAHGEFVLSNDASIPISRSFFPSAREQYGRLTGACL